MYINDPSEKAHLPVKVSAGGLEEEEVRPASEFFWDDVTPGGKYLPPEFPIHASHQVCVFGPDGSHTYMGKDCPHFEIEDEMGKVTATGWTVQQNR